MNSTVANASSTSISTRWGGWLLNLCYLVFLAIASPWLLWRRLVLKKSRRGWWAKLLGNVPKRQSTGPCIWFHAVSVGEVILLEPIVARLRKRMPDLEFAISVSTESGFDLAETRFPNDLVFFSPFDFTWAIGRVMDHIRPSIFLLAELEIWPNMIRVAHQRGIPIGIVNGRLSANSFHGYNRFRSLVGPLFQILKLVCVQNETYAERFRQLGCNSNRVIVTGSVKFDNVETDRDNSRTRRLRELAGLEPDEFVFVAGSTQPDEDWVAAKSFLQIRNQVSKSRLILVPRHPDRARKMGNQLEQLGLKVVYRSEVSSPMRNPNAVLIVDVIGELGAWWGCADVAYVGGSTGKRGGQNMLEPAAYGIPVSFGPSTGNFREIVVHLLENGAASVVHGESQLTNFLLKVARNPVWGSSMGLEAKNVVMSHIGGSQRTVEAIYEVCNDHLESAFRKRLVA